MIGTSLTWTIFPSDEVLLYFDYEDVICYSHVYTYYFSCIISSL